MAPHLGGGGSGSGSGSSSGGMTSTRQWAFGLALVVTCFAGSYLGAGTGSQMQANKEWWYNNDINDQHKLSIVTHGKARGTAVDTAAAAAVIAKSESVVTSPSPPLSATTTTTTTATATATATAANSIEVITFRPHDSHENNNIGDGHCLGWRQTGDCRPDGPREPYNDRDCNVVIERGNSGYCECAGGKRHGARTCASYDAKLVRCDKVCPALPAPKNKESKKTLTAATAAAAQQLARPSETVLVLVIMRRYFERFFTNLQRLTYPRRLIHVAVLIGDCGPEERAKVDRAATMLKTSSSSSSGGGSYASITVLHKDFGNPSIRHEAWRQRERRQHLAVIRNWLLVTALRSQQWVLWLDADIHTYPADMLERLLARHKRVIVPHVVMPQGRTYDLNSFQETEASLAAQKDLPQDTVLFEGDAAHPTYRKHMDQLRREGATDLVKLHGVGGGVLLVDGDLHRKGLNFPAFPVDHEIETEGLAKMAIAMGVQPYGDLKIEAVHK